MELSLSIFHVDTIDLVTYNNAPVQRPVLVTCILMLQGDTENQCV